MSEPAAEAALRAAEPAAAARSIADRIEWMNGVAINVDYRYATQEVSSTAVEFDGTPTFDVENELHTETVRLEYVPLNVLSVYAVAARHDARRPVVVQVSTPQVGDTFR